MAYTPQYKLPGRIFWSMESATVGLPFIMKVQHSFIWGSNLNRHPEFRSAVPDALGTKTATLTVPYYTGEASDKQRNLISRHGRRRLNYQVYTNDIPSGEAFGDAVVTL